MQQTTCVMHSLTYHAGTVVCSLSNEGSNPKIFNTLEPLLCANALLAKGWRPVSFI